MDQGGEHEVTLLVREEQMSTGKLLGPVPSGSALFGAVQEVPLLPQGRLIEGFSALTTQTRHWPDLVSFPLPLGGIEVHATPQRTISATLTKEHPPTCRARS